ncbi:hypothetical protein GCM10008922_18610 [Faecalicatena contorta]|uniref:YopX family protein n=1 Tax=Faecalicatena contorta TaxID=39482 RepID=UPI00129E14C9|nr:hypothetical protein [Romboutsia ilealis]
MNRVIKFRGQTRRRGEKVRMGDGAPIESNWVYGGIFLGEGDFSVIYTYEPIEKFSVYTDTIGQSTGLHDMDGKEVYEGDVIENPDGVRMEIRYGLYDAYCPVDRCNMDNVGFYAVGYGLPEMPIGCLEDYAKVIGNIYDNPELVID